MTTHVELPCGLQIAILPQTDAENRPPGKSDALISLTGRGMPVFDGLFPDAYSFGITRFVLDDAAGKLAPEAMAEIESAIDMSVIMTREMVARYRKETGTIPTQQPMLVLHCLAGMSRSTAFAVGCAASVTPLGELKPIVEAMAAHVSTDGSRRFQPNPAMLATFERRLSLPIDSLKNICGEVSVHFRTWDDYWAKRAKAS